MTAYNRIQDIPEITDDPTLAAERSESKDPRKCTWEEEKWGSGKEPQKMMQRPRKGFPWA